MKKFKQIPDLNKVMFSHFYSVRAPPPTRVTNSTATRHERKRSMKKRSCEQYPFAYKQDNTQYRYFDDDGNMIELFAGKDGVTVEIIAELKACHRKELASEEKNKRIRKDSEGSKRAMVVSLDSIDDETKEESDMFIDFEANTEEKMLQIEEKEIIKKAYDLVWSKLTSGQKDLVTQIYHHHMSQREIAKAEGVGEAAISLRMRQLNVKIRKILSKYPKVLAYFSLWR